MGAPLTDAPRLHHWSNWIQKQFDAEALMTERELIEQAVVEFYEYADALLAPAATIPARTWSRRCWPPRPTATASPTSSA